MLLLRIVVLLLCNFINGYIYMYYTAILYIVYAVKIY